MQAIKKRRREINRLKNVERPSGKDDETSVLQGQQRIQ